VEYGDPDQLHFLSLESLKSLLLADLVRAENRGMNQDDAKIAQTGQMLV
jgi:hypothetical protein